MLHLGIFGLPFEKHSHVWNQHSEIFLKAKSQGKIKLLKFRTNNTYLAWTAWTEIWKKILSFLKLAPSNLPNDKL